MELKVQKQDLKPVEFNFEELKTKLNSELERYQNLIVVEDELPKYKADKAKLNGLKKALNDERIRIKKEFTAPVTVFETRVKELVSMIDEPITCLDTQLKKFEYKNKLAKKKEITELFQEKNNVPEYSLEMCFQETWLNATKTMKSIECEIASAVDKVNSDIEAIKGLASKHEASLMALYLKCFRLSDVLQEKNKLEAIEKQIEERKAREEQLKKEQEEKKAQINKAREEKKEEKATENQEQPKTNELIEIDFRVWVTDEQKKMIRDFFVNNNIKYGSVK